MLIAHEPSLALCDDLTLHRQDGWRGGRLEREGIYVYLQLIHTAVRRKPTKHSKAIFLQLKKKINKGMSTEQLSKQYSGEQNCILPKSLCPTSLGRRGSAWSDSGCLMHVALLGKQYSRINSFFPSSVTKNDLERVEHKTETSLHERSGRRNMA